jgi:hypothetical protein
MTTRLAKKLGRYLASNVVAFLALFVALSGTAYAAVIISSNSQVATDTISGHHPPAGDHSNLISSSINAKDLAAGAVTNGKLGANSVDSSKVADGSLTGLDIANGTLTGTNVASGTLSGADLQNDSITGTQVNESTLGEVPLAKIAGLGRSTSSGSDCSPSGTAYVDCVILTVNLPSTSRVLLIGQGTAAINSGDGSGYCKLVTQFGDVPGTTETLGDASQYDTDSFALSGVTGVLGPGSVDFAIDCNNGFGGVYYFNLGLTALAISPD